MNNLTSTYRVRAILTECARLQRLESRWDNHGVAELMRQAAETGDSLVDPTVFVLCRLLFRDKNGGPLRRPLLGEPGFLGGGTLATPWPDEPLFFFRGVPFYIVRLYFLAGLAEAPTAYLAHCLRHGVWNPEPYPELDDDTLQSIAEEFIVAGPWEEQLRDDEIALLRQQVS